MALRTRLGAYACSLALLAAVLGTTAPGAEAVPSNNPVGIDTGRDWLESHLVDGITYVAGSPDYLATVDSGLALAAIDDYPAVDQIADAMSTHIADLTGSTQVRSDFLAELAVLADIAGDPTSYGGRDLVSEVSGLVATASPVEGRLEDGGTGASLAGADTSDVNGQAYAVRLLTAAGDPKAAAARDFLLLQQCPAGGFRLSFTPDRTATAQECTDDSQANVDTTARVVTQLSTLPSESGLTSALTSARTWLAARQHPDGSWGGGDGTSPTNAVSTGLAALALGTDQATYGQQTAQAATWLRAHQVTYYDVCDRLLNDRGAIAYTDPYLSDGRDRGMLASAARVWARTTARAMPALQFLPQDFTPSDPQMATPEGFQKGGSPLTLHIVGINAGDLMCLNSGTTLLRQFTSTGYTDDQTVVLPTVSGLYDYDVRDDYGHPALVHIDVLGPKTLSVTRSVSTVRRNGTVTAAVRGLAPGETARIYYGYDLVRTGAASDAGNFVAHIPAGTALGNHYIRGYGQFGDIRKGYTSVTVVR